MKIDWRVVLATIALATAQVSAAGAAAPSLLDSMFQDHAVLQRDRPIPIWGKARPGDQLAISINTSSVRARADAAGHWRASLPAMPAGGPYTLEVHAQSGAGEKISDLLVGDVWLCSGQSNMELPVSRTLNAADEISASANNLIRVLTVAHASSPVPLEEFAAPVAWRVAERTTIGEFSAACYYFARELQKTVAVPMG